MALPYAVLSWGLLLVFFSSNPETRVCDVPDLPDVCEATKVSRRKPLTPNRLPVCAGTRRQTEDTGSRVCTALLAV
jgi:hypothetical protein